MDNLLGDFLRARRELVRPEEHGLPDFGRRRVAGLRREEVAMLAGISAEYYVRLERGRDRHPSDQVLDALARVLGLDAESRTYLGTLVAAPPKAGRATTRVTERARPAVVRLLAAMPTVPAFVLGRTHDVLAYNRMAQLLCGHLPENMLRHVFLDPAAREMYPDWADVAAEAVAALRASAGADVNDPAFAALVGELSVRSADFSRLWARHEVRAKTSGSKRMVSPSIGLVELAWESLSVSSAPGQLVVTYFAPAGSASEAALRVLGDRAWDAAAGVVVPG